MTTLKLVDNISQVEKNGKFVDMSSWSIPKGSSKASDIIKKMLVERNGKVVVHTVSSLLVLSEATKV